MCFTYVYVRMCYNMFWCYHKQPKKNNPFITQHCSLRAPGTKTWPWPSWQWKSDAAWPLWRSNETALFYGLLQKTTGLYTKNWFIMFILTSQCQNMGPFKKQCVGCSLLEWQHLKSWHPSWDFRLSHGSDMSAGEMFFEKGCRRCLEAAQDADSPRWGNAGSVDFPRSKTSPQGRSKHVMLTWGKHPGSHLSFGGMKKDFKKWCCSDLAGARNMDIGMQIVSTGTARPGTMVWFKELI